MMDGEPLLNVAAVGESCDIALLLLESGCNPNSIDRDGYTALYAATKDQCVEGHDNLANICQLLEKGADSNVATTKLC